MGGAYGEPVRYVFQRQRLSEVTVDEMDDLGNFLMGPVRFYKMLVLIRKLFSLDEDQQFHQQDFPIVVETWRSLGVFMNQFAKKILDKDLVVAA